ncbi:DUF5675 family protein [Bizionia paragorgiae]|uniref:DUF5675 domain-containing protein n=1 Tax=Bizionia paragorgiae TaxID=283786 RepID=A0A1H4B7Z8_BIZPA|nr:DUF5675 family protein [Bizionia paragorgiae]MDX1353680.1 DUF5675 family protein [Thiomicrorhabdus sp.]SEA44271.1 hypothetical protein SAMN04487990_11383 [Bizionia paragorgiae]
MELLLQRQYFKEGTNSALFVNGHFICFMIELPWLNNKRQVSCIPEGVYELKPRFSDRFGDHLHVLDVSQRNLILIHPANNASKELEGCLAPVSQLSGVGVGWSSRLAMQKILSLCHQAFERKEFISLTINH